MASYLYRTATTAYPCCLPTLGDLAGAGRIRLAAANIGVLISYTNYFLTLIKGLWDGGIGGCGCVILVGIGLFLLGLGLEDYRISVLNQDYTD